LPAAIHGQDSGFWTAIDPSDLKLGDNPKLPGGPPMNLDYWHDVNNLQYFAKYMQVEDIRARTVTPQGVSSDYNGGIIEKEMVKAKQRSGRAAVRGANR
jgi:hypothetical protein